MVYSRMTYGSTSHSFLQWGIDALLPYYSIPLSLHVVIKGLLWNSLIIAMQLHSQSPEEQLVFCFYLHSALMHEHDSWVLLIALFTLLTLKNSPELSAGTSSVTTDYWQSFWLKLLLPQ